MQLDYNKEKFTKVIVCGIECDFSDMRIDRSTVPEGLYQYEVADDESQGDPTRIKKDIMVSSFVKLINDVTSPLVNNNVR